MDAGVAYLYGDGVVHRHTVVAAGVDGVEALDGEGGESGLYDQV